MKQLGTAKVAPPVFRDLLQCADSAADVETSGRTGEAVRGISKRY